MNMYFRTHERFVRDPATSHWLKEAIRASIARDPVDALNDAEALVVLCQSRLDLVTIQAQRLIEFDQLER